MTDPNRRITERNRRIIAIVAGVLVALVLIAICF